MKTLLVPHDFSPSAENALNYAIELASYLSAKLVLLNVSLFPVMSPDMNLMVFSFDEMKEDGLTALRRLSEQIREKNPSLVVDCRSELGDVGSTIEDYAKKEETDLIVMGISRQDSTLVKTLVGSNAVDVSRHVDKPVLIVPEGVKFHKVQNVVFASDYDEKVETGTLLIRVKYFSSLFNAMLHVLHVMPEGHGLSQKEAAVDDYIEHQLQGTEHRTWLVNEKRVAPGILKFVGEHHIDLIIAEPKKHSIFHSSITKEIAFSSDVPVLMLHGGEV